MDISVVDTMRPASISPAELLPLTPAVFHILLALAPGERHGYAIMSEVAAATDGEMRMGPGTLYGTLKRLLRQALVVESAVRPDPALDDERRRYYQLTDLGRRVLQAESQRYARLVSAARARGIVVTAAPSPLS